MKRLTSIALISLAAASLSGCSARFTTCSVQSRSASIVNPASPSAAT